MISYVVIEVDVVTESDLPLCDVEQAAHDWVDSRLKVKDSCFEIDDITVIRSAQTVTQDELTPRGAVWSYLDETYVTVDPGASLSESVNVGELVAYHADTDSVQVFSLGLLVDNENVSLL